jgi:hypothetical protein
MATHGEIRWPSAGRSDGRPRGDSHGRRHLCEAVPSDYEGAVIQRGRRERLEPCVVQPRDVSIVGDVRRYKFLMAPQVRELWWPQSSVQAADRRLLKLFRAGYLDRFRPSSRRGCCHRPTLGMEGHRPLQLSLGATCTCRRSSCACSRPALVGRSAGVRRRFYGRTHVRTRHDWEIPCVAQARTP